MNISSVILRARPERHPQLLAQLAEVPGLEVHGASPDGKLILTLELHHRMISKVLATKS